MNYTRRMSARLAVVLVLVLGGLPVGCSSPAPLRDPIFTLRDPESTISSRRRAISDVRAGVEDGTLRREDARPALKTLAWSASTPIDLRLVALDAILSDEAASEDSREMVRLMIAREPDARMVGRLAQATAENGWTEATPSLVRSLSRPDGRTPDDARPEAKALRRLHPDRTLAEVAFAVFVDPPREEAAPGLRLGERARSDAWSLLSRLDRDGEVRLSLFSDTDLAASDPVIEAMRACVRDLRTIPITGEEIRWLESLRADDAAWSGMRDAVASLDRDRSRGLRLRHMPVILWCSRVRPELLARSPGDLRAELGSRIASEKVHRRRTGRGEPVPAREESLDQPGFSWGDLLAAQVVRDALDDPSIARSLFDQADLDREDRTTEYGGLLLARESQTLRVALYPPRPAQRRGDREFVASEEMLDDSTLAFAHYHFHVQTTDNAEFAGPSATDLDYAQRLGRTCLVLTSVRAGVLGADLYIPGGLVLDLGEVRRP